jgi:hypothetical protein
VAVGPTKWLIWILSKLGLTSGLRRVPQEVIYSAQARLLNLEGGKSHDGSGKNLVEDDEMGLRLNV